MARGPKTHSVYTLDDAGKRAVGFKLSEGMEVPDELSRPQALRAADGRNRRGCRRAARGTDRTA